MEDEYILYTDCDVMFMDQVTKDLEKLSCRYFAVAPEFDSKDYQLMNTGVMLMNLKNLIAVEEKVQEIFGFKPVLGPIGISMVLQKTERKFLF